MFLKLCRNTIRTAICCARAFFASARALRNVRNVSRAPRVSVPRGLARQARKTREIHSMGDIRSAGANETHSRHPHTSSKPIRYCNLGLPNCFERDQRRCPSAKPPQQFCMLAAKAQQH